MERVGYAYPTYVVGGRQEGRKAGRQEGRKAGRQEGGKAGGARHCLAEALQPQRVNMDGWCCEYSMYACMH